ncbi:MAG: hypothetical protein M3R70_10800 [Actinomycetota bacterium]|nr:hypothetical protein [Actinomycetota bacterium]
MSIDEITLTIPRDEEFQHVAQLVLGGVAARMNLSYESLDDLATALDSLLEHAGQDGDVTVSLSVEKRAIRAAIGPFHGLRLSNELERGGEADLGLRRVLETVVDDVGIDTRDDGEWVELTKRVQTSNGNP